jgi:hypothetical protein
MTGWHCCIPSMKAKGFVRFLAKMSAMELSCF